jgi:uncharacterized protein YqeY
MVDSIKARIAEDTKAAMRAREKERLGVLRMVNAAIKQVEIDERVALDDTGVIDVLEKMVRQRREAEEQYRALGQPGRAELEGYEIGVIQAYLPKALSESEVDALIEAALASTGAGSVKDMGRVMAVLRPELKGRADLRAVGEKVKRRLA